MLDTHTEVIIAGAGIAGMSFAAHLRQHGIDATIIAGKPLSRADDARVLALTPASSHGLHKLGIWQAIRTDQIGYFRTIYVCDTHGGEIRFDSTTLGEPAMAYTVRQTVLEYVLTAQLAGLHWYRPATVAALDEKDDHISVTLNDGRRITAHLLVAADGASSVVRKLAGIGNTYTDYHQHALACILQTERPHHHHAWQKFLREGPLALLPMAAADQYGVVWSTTSEKARTLLGIDHHAFHHAVEEATGNHVGMVLNVTARATFPLAGIIAKRLCAPRIALVGDAARHVHPLAGQGANLGLLDAMRLADIVVTAHRKQRDIGAYKTLRKYERRCTGDNVLMYKTLEGFKYLFEDQRACITRLRNVGMNALDRFEPIKKIIVRRAMGLG